MKRLLLCLLPAALPAFGGHQVTSLAPIVLYAQFQQEPPPPRVFDALKAELDSVMAPTDLRFTWRTVAANLGNEASVELAVITFNGMCDVAGLTPHNSKSGPLGWTHISDAAILPYAGIDCQAIRSFIQKQLLALPADKREETYGRALARVVAHELYHIFANTTKHGARGLGKPAFSVEELLSPTFRFEARESLALRDSKAHAVLECAALGQ